MGVIRKKTATRGAEGGVKFVCDVCSADITSTVRIRCAHSSCNDYDLCVPCFSKGEGKPPHDPRTHPFNVIEQNSVPIYDKNWGADEELLLLEGAEIYGLGSWADVADHIGGFRNKDEVANHYKKIYTDSSNFPLPERASPQNRDLEKEMPRENFQAIKKRRIEQRKEAAKNAPPATPKQKPTASVPSCHEVQGYMPGRLEFETEYANEAEEAVQHMQFDPGDGIKDHATGELEPEMELKMTVMDIYNTKLTQRVERKKVIFEHNLLEYRKNAALDKKRSKEERDLLLKAKPFARMMNQDDFEAFDKGLVDELNLRLAISQLQDWRQMRVTDLKSGEKYEADKAARALRPQTASLLDKERFASSQRGKTALPVDGPSAVSLLLEAPSTNGSAAGLPPAGRSPDKALTNGNANGSLTPQSTRQKHVVVPLTNVTPLVLTQENAENVGRLTVDEVDLCQKLRLHPDAYLLMKEHVFKEALRKNGVLKRKEVKEICRLESQKGSRIYDFFLRAGWLG